MSLIVDLILLLVAAAAIYLGVSRGFVRSIMHFASLIIAVAMVYFFTQPLSVWINQTFVNGKLSEEVEDAISSIIIAGEDKLQLDMVLSERPEALTKLADRFSVDLDDIAENYLKHFSEASDSVAIENISREIASPAEKAISNVIAAIILFLGTLIILKLVVFLLDLLCHIPVLKHLNKMLGLVFGICSAVISLLIVANLTVGLIHALSAMNDSLFNQGVIDGSLIIRFLNSYGLIL